jgi:hypothetical protein
MSEFRLRIAENATVRAKITSDGQHLASVFDFMDLAYPTMSKSWKNMKWKSLTADNSEFKDEIEFTEEYLKYQDQDVTFDNTKKRRLVKTPVMTLQGLQRLLVILGGKVSSEFRTIVLGIFTRYMAGDRTMLEEIKANAVSDAPIHQTYRQALGQEPVTNTTHRVLTRDEALFNLELHERHMALHERHMALHERSWALYEKSLAFQRRK